MEETFEGLDEYMNLLATTPVESEKFFLITTCLYGKAKKSFKQLVAAHYYTDVLKTNANFGQAKKDLITKLSNHPYPGNDEASYFLNKVKYDYSLVTEGKRTKLRIYLS